MISVGLINYGPTQWQFEASVEQHPVKRWVFGTTDLIIVHDDLGVQSLPLPWTLL